MKSIEKRGLYFLYGEQMEEISTRESGIGGKYPKMSSKLARQEGNQEILRKQTLCVAMPNLNMMTHLD